MALLEVFFDYACPYCLRAHDHLEALLPDYPHIQVEWRPCEAHPRPDRYGPHSDLCIQGMFLARDLGVDLWDYHRLMYRAALQQRANIEDPRVLAQVAGELLDPDRFLQALLSHAYLEEQRAANDYAFARSGVWVVPAYRLEGRNLDAVEDVGITRRQLARFLDQA